jgi:hypothetical protein
MLAAEQESMLANFGMSASPTAGFDWPAASIARCMRSHGPCEPIQCARHTVDER